MESRSGAVQSRYKIHILSEKDDVAEEIQIKLMMAYMSVVSHAFGNKVGIIRRRTAN